MYDSADNRQTAFLAPGHLSAPIKIIVYNSMGFSLSIRINEIGGGQEELQQEDIDMGAGELQK